MQVERIAYIVDFVGKEVPKKLEKMDVNLIYVSKKANYAIVYYDKSKGEKHLVNQLNNIKGFVSCHPSLFFNEQTNITPVLSKNTWQLYQDMI